MGARNMPQAQQIARLRGRAKREYSKPEVPNPAGAWS